MATPSYEAYLEFCKLHDIKPLSVMAYNHNIKTENVDLAVPLPENAEWVQITKGQLERLLSNIDVSLGSIKIRTKASADFINLADGSMVEISEIDYYRIMENQKGAFEEPTNLADLGKASIFPFPIGKETVLYLDEDHIGSKVFDRITGFAGVLISVLYGEDNYVQGEVQPQCENTTKLINAEWFEIGRLEIV